LRTVNGPNSTSKQYDETPESARVAGDDEIESSDMKEISTLPKKKKRPKAEDSPYFGDGQR
jgi:hypothetical protein